MGGLFHAGLESGFNLIRKKRVAVWGGIPKAESVDGSMEDDKVPTVVITHLALLIFSPSLFFTVDLPTVSTLPEYIYIYIDIYVCVCVYPHSVCYHNGRAAQSALTTLSFSLRSFRNSNLHCEMHLHDSDCRRTNVLRALAVTNEP